MRYGKHCRGFDLGLFWLKSVMEGSPELHLQVNQETIIKTVFRSFFEGHEQVGGVA